MSTARGASVWKWAGNDDPSHEPDVVLACAGDIVTMEVVAAARILRERLPQLRTRIVNVVDLMTLIRPKIIPTGWARCNSPNFTESVDVIFAFHGFPGAIHQVLHGRPDADRFHVRGYIEEGTTTTPFDMTALNRVTRYHLVKDAITNARRIPAGAGQLLEWCEEKLQEHNRYVVEHLEDLPEIRTGIYRNVDRKS